MSASLGSDLERAGIGGIRKIAKTPVDPRFAGESLLMLTGMLMEYI